MKDTPGGSDESLPVRRSMVPPATPPPYEYADEHQSDSPPPSGGKKISFRLVTRALRRHWWQALLLWAVGTGGMVAYAYTRIKPTFDAQAQIKVELDTGSNGIFGPGANQVDFGQFMQSQAHSITNPNIIGAALAEHPELNNTSLLRGAVDPEIEIGQALQIGIIPRTNFIQIRMSSPLPSESAEIVNAVVDAFLKHAQQTYDTSTQKRIETLKVTKAEQLVEVKKHRAVVESLAKENGVDGLAATKERENIASLESYRRWSEELTNAQITVLTAKARLDQLRNMKEIPRQLSGDQIQMQVSDAFLSHPSVLSLQDKIDQATKKLKEVERLARNHNDPSVSRAAERVKDLKTQRDDLWQQLEPVIRRQVAATPVDNSAEAAIREADLDLQGKVAHRDALEDRLNKVKIEVKGGESERINLEYAKHDLSRAEAVLDRIQNTLDQYSYDMKNPTARVELYYKATPSNRVNNDRRKQVVAAAPLATGMLVIGLLVLLELRGGRVGDPDELASRMHLQVIGVVPPLPQIRVGALGGGLPGVPATSGDIRAQRQLDEFVQSLDHLRVALCARRDPWGRDRHCVLITSACGSEGKTTLAAQLAERCVNAGLMTLLIDADLRNPTLSRMLDAADSPGLINVLRGEMLAEDVVTVVGDAGGFHLLPAGTPRVDPSRLLQGDQLGKLIAQARESFDMIIVDAPPVLPVPDALTIGKWTDGAVLAVRYDTSRFLLVERANRRLTHVGVPVIGVVVNGVRSMESSYAGYSGYGYGSTVYDSVPTTAVEE